LVEESNEDDQWESKWKEEKTQLDAIKHAICYRNCYNEGHYTKECKLLRKFI
jgi:hypothetical protein